MQKQQQHKSAGKRIVNISVALMKHFNLCPVLIVIILILSKNNSNMVISMILDALYIILFNCNICNSVSIAM